MAMHGWQRAKEMFRTASHGLAFKAMPVLISGLLIWEASCNTQRQGASKMGDSETKETVFTKKGDGKDSTKTPLGKITPAKADSTKEIKPPETLGRTKMDKKELEEILKRSGERIRDKNLQR